MPWTKEEAQEQARKGGLARQEKLREQRQPPSEEALMHHLWEAAQALGDWKELKASERLDALKRYMEYRIGKPTARGGENPESPDDQEERGIRVE